MKLFASVSAMALLNLAIFPQCVAADPVLVLHLDEVRGTTVFNAVTGGAGNGTLINGPIRTTGVYGSGVQFDGVNDCIVVANSSHFFSANGFTIETWLRIDSDLNVDANNNWRYLVNMPGSLDLIVEQARHIGYSINVGGTRYRWWPGQTLTNLGQWYHTAWTYDPTTGTMRAYLNGVEATNTLSVTGPMTVTSSDLTISAAPTAYPPNGHGSLPGAIDEFAYYNTVLSGAEILARYTSGPPLPALAVPIPDTILFQFDEGAGRVAYDAISPRNNGSVNGGATWGAGVYGNAIHFDGVNGHVRAPLPASQSPTTGLTAEGWFYVDQNPNVDSNNNWRWIFNKGGWASPFDCILEQDRGMTFSIKLADDTGHYRFRPSGVQLPLGQWAHAAWTYDAATGQMVVYVNGTPYAYSIGTTGNLATNDLDLFLSWNSTANPSGNGAFPGWVDEFALYGYALSSNQILMRYANAPPLGPFHWSAANSSYTTDASWYGGTAPSGSDNAVISQGVCNASGLTVAGTGSLTVSRDGTLNHTGTFRVGGSGAAGTMYQFGGAVAISSDFYVADGSGSTGSRYTMTGGTLTVTGTHTVVGRGAEGHFLQEAGTVSLRRLFVSEFAGAAGSTYTMNGGTLSINATTSAPPYGMEIGRNQSGTFTLNQGTVNINNGQTLAIGVGGVGTFQQNGGVVNATGDIRIAQSASGVYTIGGGTLNVAADKSLAIGVGNAAVFTQTGGTVNIAGTMRLAESAGTGVYRLQGGTLNANAVLRGTGGAFEFTGGILHARTFGSASQPFTLSQTGGTLAPGNSIGTTSLFGDYHQAAAGTLEIEIADTGLAGTDYDLLEVAGNVTLAGQLDVVLLHGFQAALGDYFDVLTTTGTLNIAGLDLVGHLPNSLFGWWDASVRDGANGGAVLRLTAVPEPSGAILLLTALVGLLAAVRRRR